MKESNASSFSMRAATVVTFKQFPLTYQSTSAAFEALYAFLKNRGLTPIEDGFVRVALQDPAWVVLVSDAAARTRVRFELPLGEFDLARVTKTLNDKIAAESSSWARAFDGVAVFAIEESIGVQGGRLTPVIQALMSKGEHPFTCIMSTYLPASGIEVVDAAFAAAGSVTKLDIGMQTFVMNTKVWAGEQATLSYVSSHATEEWEFGPNFSRAKVQNLSLGSHHVRLPLPNDIEKLRGDPDLTAKIEPYIAELQVRHQASLIHPSQPPDEDDG